MILWRRPIGSTRPGPAVSWYKRGGGLTMGTIGLSPEQRRLVDPDTRATYILVREEVYRRLGGVAGPPDARLVPRESATNRPIEVPEGLRCSKEAFRRALPGFLAKLRLRGKWAAFHGHEQVGLAASRRR